MNENCKYCKTSKTCLENADYGSIYCQLHKKIPKVIGKTYDELQLEKEQELIYYLKEKINDCPLTVNNDCDMFYIGKMRAYQEILSKIEKSDK